MNKGIIFNEDGELIFINFDDYVVAKEYLVQKLIEFGDYMDTCNISVTRQQEILEKFI